MYKVLAIFISIAAIYFISKSNSPSIQPSATNLGHPLLGSWKLHSTNYDGTWISNEATKSLKHFTPTHFTWVDINEGNGVVTAIGGGGVDFADGYYVESINYAKGASIEKLLGVKVEFQWEIIDGFFHQRGTFPDGFYIHEKWARIK